MSAPEGSWKLQEVSEIWEEKQFYVRECYREIAAAMALLGSSGIGKLNFIIYRGKSHKRWTKGLCGPVLNKPCTLWMPTLLGNTCESIFQDFKELLHATMGA